MEMLLALLLQSAIAPEGPAPRLSYADDATAQAAPRPRVNQGRHYQVDWNAMDQSLATESRQERRPSVPARTAPPPARPHDDVERRAGADGQRPASRNLVRLSAAPCGWRHPAAHIPR